MEELKEHAGYLFGTARKNWLLMDISAASAGGFYAYLADKIELVIWSNSHAFLTMCVLLALDWITGMWNAYNRHQLETKKIMRAGYKLVFYTLLLAVAYNLGKSDPLFVWLPSAVFVPMCLVILLSFIKNLALLGFIDGKLAEILFKKIDVYKNEKTDGA